MTPEIPQEEMKWLFDEMLEVRRELHQHPELGGEEYHTQAYLLSKLQQASIEATSCADTGIVAIVRGALPGRTVAIRADIDALPIEECSDDTCCSTCPGLMHACGHDLHTAIALGTALFFQTHREQLTGNVKFFFQPAEETFGGAKRMVEAGCLENPPVDACIGLHVMPSLPVGTIETRHGTLNASTDSFEITVCGLAAHGARPEEGIDALVAGTNIVSALQSVVSRTISSVEPAVVTIGSFHAGTAGNVIADRAQLSGTFRASNETNRAKGRRQIERICHLSAEALCARAEICWDEFGYNSLVNDDDVVDRIFAVGERVLGKDHVIEKPQMSMGGEDFSFFIEKIPGAFYHLGCQKAGCEEYGLHTAGFAPDETCMMVGCRMHVALCLDLLENPIK